IHRIKVVRCPDVRLMQTVAAAASSGGLCTKNTSRALIERPYSCAPQAVGAVYDRPGFFVQSPSGVAPARSGTSIGSHVLIGCFANTTRPRKGLQMEGRNGSSLDKAQRYFAFRENLRNVFSQNTTSRKCTKNWLLMAFLDK